jgi:hypothetical protein
MTGRLALVLALGGCTTYFGGDDAPPTRDGGMGPGIDASINIPPPANCSPSFTLILGGPYYEQQMVTLTDAGATTCVRLDATARTHPTYFEVKTPMQPGTQTNFGLALFSADDHLISAGYDAPLNDMQTYQTASMSVETSTIFDVKVVAWSHSPSAATTLSFVLYAILD